MEWPSIRDFLDVPSYLTGENIAIAVVDGYFPPHPDITTKQSTSRLPCEDFRSRYTTTIISKK